MIKPTIGRVVWYKPDADFQGMYDESQFLPALVCFVYSDTDVNLAVFDNEGFHYNATHVFLKQEDSESVPTNSSYCQWMPYQIGQAKKFSEQV